MKKFIISIVLISALCLTACTNEGTSVETTTVAETNTTTEATTTVSENTTVEETTTATEITTESIDYSNFSVADYCGEFDNVKPVTYTIEETEFAVGNYTSEQEQAAMAAIKTTDDYAEVINLAKEMFTYDSGTFTATADYAEHFMAKEYINYMSYENDDFAVTPVFESMLADKLGGVLLVYTMPLPDSKLESSNSAICNVPVYVNANNEAYVLTEITQQYLSGTVKLINYADGETHLMFEKGGSQGTQQNVIYSFNNGVSECVYAASYIDPNADGTVFVCNYNIAMFFRDEVSNSYCNVAVEEASEELAEIIINAEAVNKAFPDIKEYYAENGMKVFGGKYIQACNTAFTFENGEVVEYGDYCWVSSNADDTNYNVKL